MCSTTPRATFAPEVARSAELLTTQLDRFETLLADLLEIRRIDAGAAQLDFEELRLVAVVRDEVEAIGPAAAGAGVPLRLWAVPGEHTASMDRSAWVASSATCFQRRRVRPATVPSTCSSARTRAASPSW